MIGVWLMEYELSAIADYLRDIRESAIPLGGPQSHADIYIISGQGKVIGHPLAQTVRDREGNPELIPAREHEDKKLANAYAHASESSAFRDNGGRRTLPCGKRAVLRDGHAGLDGADRRPGASAPRAHLRENRVAAWIAALAALLSGAYAPAPGARVGVVVSGANTTAVRFDDAP